MMPEEFKGPPVVILIILSMLYARDGEIDAAPHVGGVSCVAVGLPLAVIARMIVPLLKKRNPVALLTLLALFVAVGLLRWPLPSVLLVSTRSVPVSC